MKKDLLLPHHAKPRSKELAGTIILDEALENIVIVKGKRSQKWGLPKGHIEPGEAPLAAALRETHEETGLEIQLLVDVLPCILSKRAKLFLLTLPREDTRFQILDEGEILEVMWFPIENLSKLSNQTRMLKSIISRMNHIKDKIKLNKVNYMFLNRENEKPVDSSSKFILNKYLFYYLIQNIHKRHPNELIKIIQREFKGIFYEPELRIAIKKIAELCKNEELQERFLSLVQISNASAQGAWKIVCKGSNKNIMNLAMELLNN